MVPMLEKKIDAINKVIENGTYKDSWESLVNHKVPDWYRNGKFGIFIHWGVFSVPAYGSEWYPNIMYNENFKQEGMNCFKHHVETYGAHKDFGYKDFIPMFKAEKFNETEWIDTVKKSGAKFVMPVAEHHDGFQMYDSELSQWCASKMGPHKDILGLLKSEAEKNGIVFTASSHRAEHYWFMGCCRKFDSGVPENTPYGDLYWPSVESSHIMSNQQCIDVEIDEDYLKDWLVRTCEIIDKYKPKMLFFDWWIQVKAFRPYIKKFMAYYYNRALEWGSEVTINYKHDACMLTSGVRDLERGQLADVSPYFWQTDTSVANNSWCYTENNFYKTPYDIICNLVDIVSKNGALLLNIGPKADGTIPDKDKEILLEIGKWLSINGEGIYNTYPWKRSSEGPVNVPEGMFTDTDRTQYTCEDFRFTYKQSTVYAFALKCPDDGVMRIKEFGRYNSKFNGDIKSIEVLGAEKTEYVLCDKYLSVTAKGIDKKYPVCIKISYE